MNKRFNGRRVRAWCIDADISQDELAAKIGVKTSVLKSWIYGSRGISFDQACAIADAFDKSVDELRIPA